MNAAEHQATNAAEPPSPVAAAIVTGASRGIGEALARALAANGVPVGLLARDRERLRATVESIRAEGGIADFRAVDVTGSAATSHAVRELGETLGAPLGLLVNNAGRIDREVALWEADPDQWRGVIETNLIGSFNVSRAAIPLMLERGGGRVVEIVSGAGAKDWAKASAYVASKAAMIRNVGHLHEAGFAQGLRSFAVSPGTVRTAMSTSMELHANRTEFTPVERTEEIVVAIHRGELDAWSGKYLRVTHDTPASLAAYAAERGAPEENARRLAIVPWGDDDPQSVEALVPKTG